MSMFQLILAGGLFLFGEKCYLENGRKAHVVKSQQKKRRTRKHEKGEIHFRKYAFRGSTPEQCRLGEALSSADYGGKQRKRGASWFGKNDKLMELKKDLKKNAGLDD